MSTTIKGKTKILGIFGYPVKHTFSPAMHNAVFAELGLDYVYVPFEVNPDNIARAVDSIRALDLAGVNVTIPHKSAVLPHLDVLDRNARIIGAVNTIVNDGGVLTGYNTDAPGFVKSLEEDAGVSPKGKQVFILGAGGAARAISIQLALAGAGEIRFSSPFPQEITGLSQTILEHTSAKVGQVLWSRDEISKNLGAVDIFINATPVGMHPHHDAMPPVELAGLPKNALVCDLIYNPRETLLQRKAKERGLAVLNGMGMLLYQGAIAFQLWTGIEPPIDIMRNALEKSSKTVGLSLEGI